MSFSGSTFFDMTLANDPKGFSCGEVCNLFFPYRHSHIETECGCSDSDCSLWRQLSKHGYAKLFPTIFERFPELEFVVDSSKDVFWIARQQKALQKHGIRAKHVLIWKDLLDAAVSFKKRHRLHKLERFWVNYHRLYATYFPEFAAVSYRRLTTERGYLKAACDYLEIPFFEGKEQFWKKTHHTLLGNTSAKIHLYQDDRPRQTLLMRELSTINEEHTVRTRIRSVYYETSTDRELMDWVSRHSAANPLLSDITRHVEGRDVLKAGTARADSGRIRSPYLHILKSRLRTWWLRSMFRLRNMLGQIRQVTIPNGVSLDPHSAGGCADEHGIGKESTVIDDVS